MPAQKISREQFLEDHSVCCFCGGVTPSTSLDHVPPQACFPKGFVPEGIEFPACKSCNDLTRPLDQVLGYYTMLLDHDRNNLHVDRAGVLFAGMVNNTPDALPEFRPTPNTIRAVMKQHGIARTPGLLLRDEPIVRSLVLASTRIDDAAVAVGRKLGCALYYRHKKRILTSAHRICTGWHQLQDTEKQDLNGYLSEVLQDVWKGSRANIKQYGDRLTIRTGDSADGLFVYMAQFGKGMVVWGVVASKEQIADTVALRDCAWPVFDPPSGGQLDETAND